MKVRSKLSAAAKGFTLVELAIVLVILATLAAAVTSGYNIVMASKRNKVVSDLKAFRTAYDQFKLKYESTPGDMSDAEDNWGSGNTDNGDGDKTIDEMYNSSNEEFLAWQHLNLADFLKGKYSGSKTTGIGVDVQFGYDVPSAPYDKSGYRMAQYQFSGSYASTKVIQVGRDFPVTSHILTGVLDPGEASSIDEKMDDTYPESGSILIQNGYNQTGCVTSAEFVLSTTDTVCLLSYELEPANKI